MIYYYINESLGNDLLIQYQCTSQSVVQKLNIINYSRWISYLDYPNNCSYLYVSYGGVTN